ncbi:MAG: hypothetical protein AAFY57_03035 [Cyanobacteria bacterium J06642_2]
MKTTIVGSGRIGNALAQMGEATIIRRGEAIPAGDGPIYVCTRNDDLDAVVAATPPARRADLVFLQNGMLRSWLESRGLQDNTQALIYFAVQKLGDRPVDGGGTVVWGRWGLALTERLQTAGLDCKVVDRATFDQQMIEKLLWNCIFGLLSQRHATSVGEVVARHADEVEALVRELTPIAERTLKVQLEPGVAQRLCDYSKSVADYRGAVKELPWRNGWFLEIERTPLHVRWLEDVGIVH